MGIPDLVQEGSFDATIVIHGPGETEFGGFGSEFTALTEVDKSAATTVAFLPSRTAGRLVFSATGSLNRDTDDVRKISDAVNKGVVRAVAAGCVAPKVLVCASAISGKGFDFGERGYIVALSVALGTLYVPKAVREFKGENFAEPVKVVGFDLVGKDAAFSAGVAKKARALEVGKRLAKDIGHADPEEGTPELCTKMITDSFAGLPGITIEVEADEQVMKKGYPLFHAVARTSLRVPRHAPRIVKVTYEPVSGPVTRQVYLVGKGVVYDTGGADVKTGGNMCGMSRDKCGAGSVAGLLRTAAELQTPGVRLVAKLAFVRNSIGSDAYVADEVIVARSGKRIMVRNTDAEGRMAMADLLAEAVEEIAAQPKETRPETIVHTVATLTGHAALCVGPYSIAVENGASVALGAGAKLQAAGESLGDPLEHWAVRREDFAYVAPKTNQYDILQCGNTPSATTPRGHQFPAAFLQLAANLEKHDMASADPIAFCHFDVAGSTVNAPYVEGVVNGNPVPALCGCYLGL